MTWTPTEGRVIDSWTETFVVPPRSTKFGQGSFVPRNQYVRWVSYWYEVNGKTYFAKELGSGGDWQGKIIRIYYDPSHPERSTSDQPVDSIFLPALTIILFAGGAGVGLSRFDGNAERRRRARAGSRHAHRH